MQNTQDITVSSHEIKLPSADVVTADNLWQFVLAITSVKFTQRQLQGSLKTFSMNTIMRILAYLKYLNYLKESREEETQGGKKTKVQYFIVNKDQPLVNDIQYDVKAGSREEDAKKKWHQLIREHNLSRIIAEEFFSSEGTKTKIDLENFLKARKELSGKQPSYYQYGVNFILKLLGQAGLLSVVGSNINLTAIRKTDKELDAGEAAQEETKEGKADQKSSNKTYKVTIVGPDLNTSMDIIEEFDIEIVNKFLEKIKNKLSVPPSEGVSNENPESTN